MIIELKKTADQVKLLENKESWELEFDSEHGAITQLVTMNNLNCVYNYTVNLKVQFIFSPLYSLVNLKI